jgi:carbon monoxide dehydrogenase subunit G
MELSHEFRVDEAPERVWEVMTDIPTIAPCMPGAELQEVLDDEYRGVVKVKLGPITAQYKGVARFVERDDDARRAVLRAEGRETRGQGNANATITARLEPDGDGTRVAVVTDLTITGRVAQFGRGVLADVSTKLLDQFVACLERKLAGETPSAEPDTGTAPAADAQDGPAPTDAAEAGPMPGSAPAEPVDLLGTAGAPVGKRILPVAVVAVVALWWYRRRHRSRGD